MPSGQDTDLTYSTDPGACTEHLQVHLQLKSCMIVINTEHSENNGEIPLNLEPLFTTNTVLLIRDLKPHNVVLAIQRQN